MPLDVKKDIQLTDESIGDMKTQAHEFLQSGYFFAAEQFYKKIIEAEPDNKDFHISYLMAKNRIKEEDKLVPYYQDLFSNAEHELKLACDKDVIHIEDMAEKSHIPGYLDKEEIREAYEFDLTYHSSVFCREKQKKKIIDLIDTDESLSWLKKNGFSEIKEIIKAYDRRIDQAKEDDQINREKKKNEYQRFLYQTYARIKDLNKAAKKQKDDDYKSLIRSYENSEDPQEVRELIASFERFGDYKKAKSYIDLCEEKIEELRQKAKDDSLKQQVSETIDQARVSLMNGKYGEAYDGFARAVSMDQDNEEAHLGILMAQTKTNDAEELFEYYKDLYSEEKKESLEACEEDSRHIEEMVRKFYLPEYLDEQVIREKYLFDRTYLSGTENRISQMKQITEDLEMNPVLMWLKEKGSDHTKEKIDELFGIYQNRIDEAKQEDEENIEKIRNEYQRFLFNTYADLRKLHKQANDAKDEEYKQIIHSYQSSNDEEELLDLIERLKLLDGYKDSEKHIAKCLQKIEELEEKKKNISIQQEVETTLIAGRSYLIAGNSELANRSFDKALSLDPDNPWAYLGILMIETHTKNDEELIAYYSDLFDDESSELLEACQIDREHIDRIADRYCLPGYFEKDTIRKYYNFDRSFESMSSSREQQKKQLEEEFEMNPLLVKIFAREDEEIKTLFDRIRKNYDDRIRQAKEADKKQRKSIEHIYEIYLGETDKTVEKIYIEKLKERNEDCESRYQENVSAFDDADSIEVLEGLIERFKQDQDYKDSREYIESCKDRIRSIRVEKEKDTLEALFAEGDELLDKKMYHQAIERFVSYLNINPDDEDAYLYLLMAETQTLDIDSLFDYYKQLYAQEKYELRSAFELNDDHVEEICGKCYIPELLEKEEIRKMYSFDPTFESLYSSRIEERNQIEAELDINPSLLWLKQNGSPKVRDEIDELLDTYDERIAQAEEEDQKKIDSLEKEYRAFLRSKDREVRSLYNSLLKEKSEDRRKAEKERKELDLRRKEEAEREKKHREDEIKAELGEKEKRKLAEKEEKRLIAEKEKLEKEAKKRLEKEKKKQERTEKAKKVAVKEKPVRERKKIDLPKPNIGIVAAVISLLIFAGVSYYYLYLPGSRYNNAVSLVEQGEYDRAAEIFEQLGDFRDSVYKTKETIYLKADSLYEQGDLVAAAQVFKELRFDDSEERVQAIRDELINNAEVGSSILFGQYDQDGDDKNGKEYIEWIVLDIEDDRLLLVSRYGIDNQVYNSEQKETIWRDSELRGWLNTIFLNNILDFNDRSKIVSVSLENDPFEADLYEDDLSQFDTVDKVFVFNSEEIEYYYPDPDDRQCKATAYAIENGAMTDNNGFCSWWLRSVGNGADTVEYVWNRDGTVASSMPDIQHAIRPAMWLRVD